MQDYLDAISPGEWDFGNAAELAAVLIGGYLIVVEGRVNLGLTLVGVGVGMENLGKLRKTNAGPQDREE